MRRSIIKWRVSLVREEAAEKCSLCFSGFACKLAAPLVNGIKIKMHPIIVFVLVFKLRVSTAFVN